MWSRKVIKESARGRISINYWRMVLASLVLAFAVGGGSTPGFNYRGDSQEVREVYEDILQGQDPSDESGSSDEYLRRMSPKDRSEGDLSDVIDQYLVGDYFAMMAGIGFFAVLIALAIAIPLKIFVLNPLQIGGNKFFFKNIKEAADLKELGAAFDHDFLNKVKIMFLRDLFVSLWTLLFIIPGIIKAYEYRMIPYLLAEDSSMSHEEAFAISKRMMTGNKWNAFVFDLSFLGWYILGALTFGILNVFYVNPYFYQADAMLYDAIKFDDGFQPRNSEPVVEPIVDEMI